MGGGGCGSQGEVVCVRGECVARVGSSEHSVAQRKLWGCDVVGWEGGGCGCLGEEGVSVRGEYIAGGGSRGQ